MGRGETQQKLINSVTLRIINSVTLQIISQKSKMEKQKPKIDIFKIFKNFSSLTKLLINTFFYFYCRFGANLPNSFMLIKSE